jgi:hypothetical protein
MACGDDHHFMTARAEQIGIDGHHPQSAAEVRSRGNESDLHGGS